MWMLDKRDKEEQRHGFQRPTHGLHNSTERNLTPVDPANALVELFRWVTCFQDPLRRECLNKTGMNLTHARKPRAECTTA
mmetsp:Transcript_10936/g.15770  ORF Transcript_10936/g.15770 Transcript_10936/m.15770 type:complete len:80 (+) Transcript_10936:1133-1372(+)